MAGQRPESARRWPGSAPVDDIQRARWKADMATARRSLQVGGAASPSVLHGSLALELSARLIHGDTEIGRSSSGNVLTVGLRHWQISMWKFGLSSPGAGRSGMTSTAKRWTPVPASTPSAMRNASERGNRADGEQFRRVVIHRNRRQEEAALIPRDMHVAERHLGGGRLHRQERSRLSASRPGLRLAASITARGSAGSERVAGRAAARREIGSLRQPVAVAQRGDQLLRTAGRRCRRDRNCSPRRRRGRRRLVGVLEPVHADRRSAPRPAARRPPAPRARSRLGRDGHQMAGAVAVVADALTVASSCGGPVRLQIAGAVLRRGVRTIR